MYGEKKTQKKKKLKKRFIRIFWWTLFFHAMIFLVILDIAFKKTPKIFLSKKPLPKLLQKPQNELPASLKPRKSVFGSTVLFDDKADFKPPQSKLSSLKEQPGEDNIQGPSQKSIPQQKTPEVLPNKKELTAANKKSLENKPPEKKDLIKKSAPKKEMLKKQTLIENEKAMEEDKLLEKIEDNITKKQALASQAQNIQDSPNSENTPHPKITKTRTFGTSQKDKCPLKTPRKSIVSMTKGFIENIKDEGEDWLERKGDDNKRPSFEELKYISYEEKIQWHLQNIWKENIETQLRGKAIINFKIKENGEVIDIKIIQSSGCVKLDNLIIRNIERASPFPPIPKHFESEIFQTGRIFNINI